MSHDTHHDPHAESIEIHHEEQNADPETPTVWYFTIVGSIIVVVSLVYVEFITHMMTISIQAQKMQLTDMPEIRQYKESQEKYFASGGLEAAEAEFIKHAQQ